MGAMRKSILLACCLMAWICGVHAQVAGRANPNVPGTVVGGVGTSAPWRTSLLSEDQSAYVFSLPPTARVVGHDMGGAAGGVGTCPDEADDKLIYSNLGNPAQQMVYRPPYAGVRIADDIVTNAVGACEIHKYVIRVNGGVLNGWFHTFTTRVALTTYCPSRDYWGPTIPGTELSFRRTADINDVWELEVDFFDPNIGICSDGRACRFVDDAFGSGAGCEDGSECMERTEPVVIPSQVWLRVEFSTNTAGWLVGAPPVVGFSADKYDQMFAGCNTWFGGYPTWSHASFYAQVYASTSCPTHFLAYLTSDHHKPAYVEPWAGTKDQLMADDIELIVDDCELSTLEIGTHGIHGRYEIDFDLRTFPPDNPIPGTQFHWVSDRKSGVGNLEIARLEFAPGVFLGRDFWLTWKANKRDAGVINAQRNLAGGQSRIDLPGGGQQSRNHYFGWYDPPLAAPGEWNTQVETADGLDAVFYVAVYCRGEAPEGPCCMPQPDMAGQDPACIDNVPVTSCLGGRWLNAESAPERIACPTSFNLGECEDGSPCNVRDQDCPDSSCAAGHDCRCDPVDPWVQIGEPPCGTHACCKPDNNCDDLPRDECIAILEEYTGRPARWNRGDFCGFNNQRCPFFACYDSTTACTECTTDLDIECDSDQICQDWLGDPYATCDPVNHRCRIPRGCTNIWCCDWLCQADSYCCTHGWDCMCRAQAESCALPPANDDCWNPERGRGAIEITVEYDPNYPALDYRGTATANHENATSGPTDICCFKQGTHRPLPGSVWYKFRPRQTGSVRIHTCDTPGASNALDSVIQVYSVPYGDIGICEDGSQCSVRDQDCPAASCIGPPCVCHDDQERLCQYLEVIACSDDAGSSCGDDGRNADLCITQVRAGELYYIVVGASGIGQKGTYKLTIEQPCDPDDIAPANSFCDGAGAASGVAPNPYELAEATLSCPAEPCVPTMSSDVWFDHRPLCTGNLIIRTCDLDPLTPEEDTTLAVYEGVDCPPAPDEPSTPEREGALLGCSDDAEASKYARVTVGMPQACASVGGDCNVDADCPKICTVGQCTVGTCTIGLDECTTDADCDEGTCAHHTCTCDDDCAEGVCARVACCGDVECDIGVCTSGDQCSVSLDDCNDGFTCVRAGDCGDGICESACGSGSLVVVPVSAANYYKIRIGGSRGSTPAGEFTITCEEQDCNKNNIPDQIDIENCSQPAKSCKDCNFNGIPDLCDVIFGGWEDCNTNGIPDRCEIRFDSLAPGGPFYCPSDCDPDVDGNGVPDACGVDLRGLARFLVCFTGEGAGVIAPACDSLDADDDGDLDLYDFAALRLSGPRS